MSQRQDWAFPVPVEQLLKLSVERREHHRERLTFWAGLMETREKTLADHGIDFRTAALPQLGQTQYSPQPMFDPVLLKDFQEAQNLVDHHKKYEKMYQLWVTLLKSRPPSETYPLDFDDAQFFGLTGEA